MLVNIIFLTTFVVISLIYLNKFISNINANLNDLKNNTINTCNCSSIGTTKTTTNTTRHTTTLNLIPNNEYQVSNLNKFNIIKYFVYS